MSAARAAQRARSMRWNTSSPGASLTRRAYGASASVVASGPRAGSRPTIGGMCGIIAYVGPRDSTAILLAGLKRLEYRGYDSAGVAVLDASGHLGTRKRAGKLGGPRRRARARGAPRRPHRHRPHPLGHAWRADRPQRAPASLGGRQARRHPQRHHRELRRAEGGAPGRRRRLPLRDRHRGRRASHRAGVPRDARPHRGIRVVVRRLDGAFTLLAVHEDQPGNRRRRPAELAARRRARRGARTSSPPTSRPSSSTRSARSRSGRTRS